MSLAQYVMLAAVLVNIWLGRWNATSWILAGAYFATQVWFLIAGTLNAGDMFMIDVAAVLLIYCRTVARDTQCDFDGAWEQFICFLKAPTPCDRAILAVFPAMWISYVLTISDFTRWWVLFGLALAQLLFAGFEGFDSWREEKRARHAPDAPSSGLQFAWAGRDRCST